MSINLSAFAGAGAQFSDANGAPLTGGLIYSYLSGTTTPVTTYTTRDGTTNNTNPIVLDAAGRTPNEIWLDGGVLYKFILKTSAFVQIGSYDDIPAINDTTTFSNLITVAGTNTLTGAATPALSGYAAGAQYSFLAQNNNTGAVTIDIDTLGVKSITKFGTTALVANDITAGAMMLIEYDGTRFQLLNPANSVFDNITVDYIRETTTVSAIAATGTVNLDVATQSILYYTTAATANWTLNVRGSASTTLNSLMSVGQTVTVTFMATQGATAYYESVLTIDGTTVTPKWQSGITPVSGNANSVDAYAYAIIKTAAATFTVLASQTRYA
jgi:hypothetical protein|tara:strand:- start:1463 stop:2443 length:981 start_codon:yes stop_codon:yes gene_type:complete